MDLNKDKQVCKEKQNALPRDSDKDKQACKEKQNALAKGFEQR